MKTITVTGFRTSNLSAKAIHLGQWLHENKHSLDHLKCYNHWEIQYDDKTIGSIKDGTITRPFLPYLASIKAEIKQWSFDISDDQWQALQPFLKEIEGTPYQKNIFLLYPLKLIFSQWFDDRSNRQLYCVESVIKILDKAGIVSLKCDLWPRELELALDDLVNN